METLEGGQVLEGLVCPAAGLGQCPRGRETMKHSQQGNGMVRFVI